MNQVKLNEIDLQSIYMSIGDISLAEKDEKDEHIIVSKGPIGILKKIDVGLRLLIFKEVLEEERIENEKTGKDYNYKKLVFIRGGFTKQKDLIDKSFNRMYQKLENQKLIGFRLNEQIDLKNDQIDKYKDLYAKTYGEKDTPKTRKSNHQIEALKVIYGKIDNSNNLKEEWDKELISSQVISSDNTFEIIGNNKEDKIYSIITEMYEKYKVEYNEKYNPAYNPKKPEAVSKYNMIDKFVGYIKNKKELEEKNGQIPEGDSR